MYKTEDGTIMYGNANDLTVEQNKIINELVVGVANSNIDNCFCALHSIIDDSESVNKVLTELNNVVKSPFVENVINELMFVKLNDGVYDNSLLLACDSAVSSMHLINDTVKSLFVYKNDSSKGKDFVTYVFGGHNPSNSICVSNISGTFEVAFLNLSDDALTLRNASYAELDGIRLSEFFKSKSATFYSNTPDCVEVALNETTLNNLKEYEVEVTTGNILRNGSVEKLTKNCKHGDYTVLTKSIMLNGVQRSIAVHKIVAAVMYKMKDLENWGTITVDHINQNTMCNIAGNLQIVSGKFNSHLTKIRYMYAASVPDIIENMALTKIL